MFNRFLLFFYLKNKDRKIYLNNNKKSYKYIIKNNNIKFDSFYKKQHLLF